jgi:hypothetical protein
VKWYLLKDRRQLGPYSVEEIVAGLRSDKFDLKDYLLPESAVKDQSSFAYVLVSSVVGPEIVFDIEKRNQKNTDDQKSLSTSDKDFRTQNKAGHEARLKELKAQFEKDLESSQLAQSKVSGDKVPATTGNIDAYSAASSYSQRVTVESSSSKLWVSLVIGCCAIGGFVIYQMGFFENQKNQVSVETSNSDSNGNSSPAGQIQMAAPQMNRPPMPSREMFRNPNTFKNRMPSSQIQLPSPTVRNVEEAPSVIQTEERIEQSQEPIAQRNPAMMKKLIRQKKKRNNSEALSYEDVENEEDPEAALEAEPANDDENNIE